MFIRDLSASLTRRFIPSSKQVEGRCLLLPLSTSPLYAVYFPQAYSLHNRPVMH